jgi:hypothetical protein
MQPIANRQTPVGNANFVVFFSVVDCFLVRLRVRCKPEIVSRLYKAQQDSAIELLPAKMSFDLATLLAITVFSSAIAGCLLLLSWLQKRSVPALALWGLAIVAAYI